MEDLGLGKVDEQQRGPWLLTLDGKAWGAVERLELGKMVRLAGPVS